MSWSFGVIGSDDIHGAPVESSPRAHVLRRYYWGLEGETEVRSPGGSKDVSMELMVGTQDELTRNEVVARVLSYESEIGSHGDFTVVINGDTVTYENCTLDAVRRIDMTPKPDISATIHTNPINNPNYYQKIRLILKQIVSTTIT